MTDTYGGPDRLADRPALPPSLGTLAERHNQHTPNTHTTTQRIRPRLPHGTVTSGLPQDATDCQSVFPIVFGDREAVLPAPSRSPNFTFVGYNKKVRGPSEFLEARQAGAGLDGRDRGPQGTAATTAVAAVGGGRRGAYCACVSRPTPAYILRHLPAPAGGVHFFCARASVLGD